MQLLAGQWDLNLETRRLTLCPRSRAMFGIGGEQSGALSELDWARSVHPDDLTAARQKMEAAVRCGEPYSERYRAVHPDGTVRPILSVGKPVSKGDAAPLRFVGFNIDLESTTESESPSQMTYSGRREGLEQSGVNAFSNSDLVPSNENGPPAVILAARDVEDARRLFTLLATDREPYLGPAREALLVMARATLAIHRSRERFFNRAVLAGPAFDLLVSLYAIEDLEIPTVKRLAELPGVPITSTLRWLQYLADKGFLSRTRGRGDRRTSVAHLTNKGRATLDHFFATFTQHGLDVAK